MALPTTRKDARKTIIKARIYRLLAILFAGGGLLAFLHAYFTGIEGHLFEAARDPWLVGLILFPFLPAVFLSWYAGLLEKRFFKIMNILDGSR